MGLAREIAKKDAAYKRAVDMLKKAALIDGHNDLPWVVRKASGGDLSGYRLDRVHAETDTDIPRLKAGMVQVQVLAAYLPTEIANPATVTLEQIDLIRRIEERYAADLMPIRRATDISAATRKKRIGSLISVEGTVGCEGSLAPLRAWKQLGVRLVTLCHNGSLPWVDSATDKPVANGLSEFGREMVAELNRLGVIIDCSHASVDAALQVVAASRAPIVLSHSNAHALCAHPRNAPDKLIKAVAAGDGVVMATFVPEFISSALWNRVARQRQAQWTHATAQEIANIDAQIAAGGDLPAATLAGFCDHVEYLLKLVGPDHVGIGSDFFGGSQPVGLEDCSTFPALFAELIRRGHGEQVLVRIAGANFIRVMRKVERVGRQIDKELSPRRPVKARKPQKRRVLRDRPALS
jgi:membrane dipeptidase